MELSKEEEKLYKNMGNNLASIRGSRSQEAIAKVVGMKTSNYNTIEAKKGERHLKDYQIVKLAMYYNVSTDYLLGLTKETTTDKDIIYICNEYGLTEDSLKALKHSKTANETIGIGFKEIDTINYLLEDIIVNKQDSIIKALNDYLFCESDATTRVNIQTRIGGLNENINVSQEFLLEKMFLEDMEYKLKLLKERIKKEGEK